MDLDEAAARLGVPVEDVERVHQLAGDRPSAPLPDKADARAILGRLAVRPDDTTEIMDGWPDPDSPHWTPELRWLLDRSIALVRADLGGHGWLSPGPELPRERGPAWRHLYVYAYLALVDVVTAYHRDHGIADAVSWVTLADLGRNLTVDRRMRGEGWPVMQSWLTLHARGGLYELGRLQHQRGGSAIDLHIPESGPLTPEAVAASLDEARAFFPATFPTSNTPLSPAAPGCSTRSCGNTCPRTPTSSGSSGGSSWSPTTSRRGPTPTWRCCGSRSAASPRRSTSCHAAACSSARSSTT